MAYFHSVVQLRVDLSPAPQLKCNTLTVRRSFALMPEKNIQGTEKKKETDTGKKQKHAEQMRRKEVGRGRTYRERQTQITDRGMDGLHCPHFASSRSVLASVPSRSINHTHSTTKLNRRGCRTISLPSLKGFFFLYRLTPLSQSLCLSTFNSFHALFPPFFFALTLSLFLVTEESLGCQLY